MKISVPRIFDENGYKGRAVCICFRDETFSEVLLMKSNVKNIRTWKIPGGHIENGEMPEEAALREMFEEAGVRGIIAQFIGKYEDTIIKVNNFVYACVVESLENEYDESDLDRERRWFPIHHAIEYLSKHRVKQCQWLIDCHNHLSIKPPGSD